MKVLELAIAGMRGKTLDDVQVNEPQTRDKLIARGDLHCIPDIQVSMFIGDSDSCEIFFDFLDTGNEEEGEEKTFDIDIHLSNNDSTDPIFMLGALALAVEKFYLLGFNTRFGRITGDN